jgi:NAD(P)-dependent dehydrogenase (short-subunit alcohol dehydrogenase family)
VVVAGAAGERAPGAGALVGKVAVVSGGSRGIGRAIVERYAAEGATVVTSARNRSGLDEAVAAVEALGGRCLAVEADAGTPEGARRPVEAALAELGRVDVLVNNVGGTVGRGHDPFAVDGDGFELTLALNLTSVWWASTAALPAMRGQGAGSIISIGSGAAIRSSAGAAYVAAKHGMVGLTKALATTAAPHGVRVNMISPGWTDTSLVDWDAIAARSGRSAAEARAAAEAENAQRRVLDPTELTGMAVLLASADGAGITGQDIHVDGGYRL